MDIVTTSYSFPLSNKAYQSMNSPSILRKGKSRRASILRHSVDEYISPSTGEDGKPICSSMIQSICVPINESSKLKEYDDLKEKDWKHLLKWLNNSNEEMVKNDITAAYGDKQRNALMSILVCHPPLEVVKALVEKGGEETVTEVRVCGFNAIHYACWGNASLDVITYLLGIGGKTALLEQSTVGGATPLHIACNRYKSSESNSLSAVIRLFVEVGELDLFIALDKNNEMPLHGLLLKNKQGVDVKAIETYFDEWYKFKIPGQSIASITGQTSGFTNHPNTNESTNDALRETETSSTNHPNPNESINNALREALHEAHHKYTQQLLETHIDAKSQILKSAFMQEYLTERFIEPRPLAVLIMDLYIQILIVMVYSFFINLRSDNSVDSTIIKWILIICIVWRSLREMCQVVTSPLSAYLSSVSNWFDVTQIICLVITLGHLDFQSSSSSDAEVFATILAWFELFTEISIFNYSLGVFYAAIVKVMKRLWPFLITALMFVATFAHAYFIGGPEDVELCNNVPTNPDPEELAENLEEFMKAGGFTCTRWDSYQYAFENLFAFEYPPGFFWIPLFYSLVMLILLLNIIIAVVCNEFAVVIDKSEVAFWSARLEIVNELASVVFAKYSSFSLASRVQELWGDNLVSTSEVSLYKRIDLNLLLESSVWDGLCNNNEEDKDLLHWWYGRSRGIKTPDLRARVKFFMTHSVPKDIFFPANVFENIILGYNRSEGIGIKSNGDESKGRICGLQPVTIMKWTWQKIAVGLCSIIFMVAINSLFVIVFISGWLSFGVLWPDMMKKQLFSVKNEKQNRTHEGMEIENSNLMKKINEMTHEVMKSNKENSMTRKDVDKMMIENSNLIEKINEMTVNMEKILVGIKPLPETAIS